MILSKHKDRYVTYVGYTNNIKNRILLHNSSKGAKFTKGKIWKLIY
ncbi:GIY-YIG nuclease family protein, partial [Candidatus Pelagibacter sp.]|nr:GIY-YIG nuclease family protein [Candidatus Pelagibacter sp.]